MTLAGDDEPVPPAGRPEFRDVLEGRRPGPRSSPGRGSPRWCGRASGRWWASPLAQAVAGDRDLRAFVETIEAGRATGTHHVVRSLAGRFGLRRGLTVVEGADIVWTLTGPDVVDRLVVRRGWSWPRFQEWLVDTVRHALFG